LRDPGIESSVLRKPFGFPPPAQPSNETAIIITREDMRSPKLMMKWSGLEECPNCHAHQPRALPVKCDCGNELAKSTCKTCGYNFSPMGARVPEFCDQCGCRVKHDVKPGFSAERMMGMFGGYSAIFAMTFRGDANQRMKSLRGDVGKRMDELYALARAGCDIERCKLSNGAIILFFYPKGSLVNITPEQLQALDVAIREADVGYLMGKEETIVVEKTLMEVAVR
jgi:hypothetical protein